MESNSEKKGKLKILTSKESGSRKYVSLSFNKDETKLVSLTGAPDWNVFHNIYRNKNQILFIIINI